jgi:cyclic pyranopterin monophosphate synthase
MSQIIKEDFQKKSHKPGDERLEAGSGRTALAFGKIEMQPATIGKILNGEIKKGNVLEAARITAMMGAKSTSSLFPHCYPTALTDIQLDIEPLEEQACINIQAYTRAGGPVGVEMEALTAVTLACLAIYDMCKSTDKQIRITDVHLVSKTGGQGGGYRTN